MTTLAAALRASRQPPDATPAPLPRDLDAVRALADEQLRFGQAEEALILLRLCQHFQPRDPATVLSLARTFAALEEWEAAEAMLGAHRRLVRGSLHHASVVLLEAVVARARARLTDARRAFVEFLALDEGARA